VNCTGVAARQMAGDEEVKPVKGQHVVVENPGLGTFFFEGAGGHTWTSVMPHGDRVVLGAVALPGDWDRTPDPAVAAAIRHRCARIEPRLADARIIADTAGVRPGRPNVRLEAEQHGEFVPAGRHGSYRTHNYGHGGVGGHAVVGLRLRRPRPARWVINYR
jgi:D-amino-acid oxidase